MVNKLVCRTCLKKVLSENCVDINTDEANKPSSNILEMISYSIPEIDIFLVDKPIICKPCIKKLERTFAFKTLCLKNEEKLLNYTRRYNSKSKVNLEYFYKNEPPTTCESSTNNNNKEIQLVKVENVANSDEETVNETTDLKSEVEINYNYANRESFDCNLCFGCEIASPDPKDHIKTLSKIYICYKCNRGFTHIQNLRKHMISHFRKHACNICGKKFGCPSNLEIHLRSHTGVKPYPCSICGKCFQQRYTLTQHVRKHRGEYVNKCNICDTFFSTTYNLKIHMLGHNNARPSCDVCCKKFNTQQALKTHLQDSYECKETNECFQNYTIKEEKQNPVQEPVIVNELNINENLQYFLQHDEFEVDVEN